jgi:hypothetical protein
VGARAGGTAARLPIVSHACAAHTRNLQPAVPPIHRTDPANSMPPSVTAFSGRTHSSSTGLRDLAALQSEDRAEPNAV